MLNLRKQYALKTRQKRFSDTTDNLSNELDVPILKEYNEIAGNFTGLLMTAMLYKYLLGANFLKTAYAGTNLADIQQAEVHAGSKGLYNKPRETQVSG